MNIDTYGMEMARIWVTIQTQNWSLVRLPVSSLIGPNITPRYDFSHKNRAIAGVMHNKKSQKVKRDPKLVILQMGHLICRGRGLGIWRS